MLIIHSGLCRAILLAMAAYLDNKPIPAYAIDTTIYIGMVRCSGRSKALFYIEALT